MSYQEYITDMNQKLHKQVSQELQIFSEEIQQRAPKEIFEAAYEITFKQDIAMALLETEYSSGEVKILLKSQHLLHEVYQEWLSMDCFQMEDIQNTITQVIKDKTINEKCLQGKER